MLRPDSLTNETYDLEEFSAVMIDGIGQVTITQGETNSLTLIAEPSIRKNLTFSVSDDTLVLGLTGDTGLASLDPKSAIQMILTVNGIKSINHSGSCSVIGAGLAGNSLQVTHDGVGSLSLTNISFESVELNLSGSGPVVVNGMIDKQTILMDGSVRFFGADTPVRMINASLNGHTQASVWVTEVLNAETAGESKLEFYGIPLKMYLGKHPENVQMLGEK